MKKKRMLETLKVSGRTIIISLLLWVIILILRPGYAGLMIIMACLVLVLNVKQLIRIFFCCVWGRFHTWEDIKKILLQLLHVWIFVSVIYYLSRLLGSWGFWGSLIIVLLIAGYKIVRSWREFLQGLREIETDIFGAPLDRQHWQDQTPKFPRIRLTQKNIGGNMKKKRKSRPVPKVLAWISIICFGLLGALAITDNMVYALMGIHNGAGALHFALYLVGVFLMALIGWLVPLVMMVQYIKHAYKTK